MSKHTSASATPQLSDLGARISRAIRRHLIGIAIGSVLTAALVAPSVSLGTAPQVRIVPHTSGQSQPIADGPNIWCSGTPLPC